MIKIDKPKNDKEMEALREVIRAWESLSGGTNYSPSRIESWLINDMKPAIDKARKVVRDYEQRRSYA